jgi:predicted Zn finger-like uncharacterized protein
MAATCCLPDDDTEQGSQRVKMILTCPACGTRYVVKDGAIPPGGRQVRCASCKHSWHQDPEPSDEPHPAEESFAEAAMIEPRSGPEAEERAFEEAALASQAAAEEGEIATEPDEALGEPGPASPPGREQWESGDDGVTGAEAAAALGPEPASEWLAGAEQAPPEEFEPFYEPDPADKPKRGLPLLVWILLLVAVLAAAGWFLAPETIREKLGLSSGGTDLEVMVTNNDRQRLASGNQLFAVSGRVINPTNKAQPVPPIKAELLDATRQKVVYSWTIAPPATALDPGASASFNSAEVDVPEGGVYLRVTLQEGEA